MEPSLCKPLQASASSSGKLRILTSSFVYLERLPRTAKKIMHGGISVKLQVPTNLHCCLTWWEGRGLIALQKQMKGHYYSIELGNILALCGISTCQNLSFAGKKNVWYLIVSAHLIIFNLEFHGFYIVGWIIYKNLPAYQRKSYLLFKIRIR